MEEGTSAFGWTSGKKTGHPEDKAASITSDAEAFDKGAGELVAAVLYADHRHCDPESCCQANSGPDVTEAAKVLRALRDGGYLR